MKTRSFLIPFAFLTTLVFSPMSTLSQTIITFDDLYDNGAGRLITNAYQGLSWSNFGVGNSILFSNSYHFATGYTYGMVSVSNTAFNWAGNPAAIDSPGTNFDFFSTYLTGAWKSNLNIDVQGFNGAQEIYDTIVVASATNPTLFTFNYLDIDRLYFNASGGEPAFGGNDGNIFVMDNFMFEFIPEPSTFLLAALGGVSLVAFLRRKRA
jgi:hypothetical protein